MKNLSSLAYQNGTIAIAAFDHRNSLFSLLNPQDPSSVTADQVVALKRLFIRAFGSISSAILIDPVYGLDYGIDLDKEVPGGTGLLMSLEESSYDEKAEGRFTKLMPHWGVSDLQARGAAAKLLLYYHPDAPIAAKQLALVADISKQCREQSVIFLIEPILYGVGDYSGRSKLDLTLRTIDQLNSLVDILKLEFPLDVHTSPEADWISAAKQLTAHTTVPWILLSRGMDYPSFKKLTQISCQAGASGIAVGRAVWQEIESIAQKQSNDQTQLFTDIETFLMGEAKARMLELITIVKDTARPWNH